MAHHGKFVAVKNTTNDIKKPVLFLVPSLNDVKKIANIYKIRSFCDTD
jgi:hypothetical protein